MQGEMHSCVENTSPVIFDAATQALLCFQAVIRNEDEFSMLVPDIFGCNHMYLSHDRETMFTRAVSATELLPHADARY